MVNYEEKKKIMQELSSYLLGLGVDFDYSKNLHYEFQILENVTIRKCTNSDLELILKRFTGFAVENGGLIVYIQDIGYNKTL